MNWTKPKVDFAVMLRKEGRSHDEIANMCSKEFKVHVTRAMVINVLWRLENPKAKQAPIVIVNPQAPSPPMRYFRHLEARQ